MIVYYRMCSIPSTNRPPIFADDKLALNKLCLRSFARAFRSVSPKVVFINDHCGREYEEMINMIVPFEKEQYFTNCGIDGTCRMQYDLYDRNDDDKVLFLECDYLFAADGQEIIDALDTLEVLSPYDHPDKYRAEPEGKYQIVNGRHYKHTISTTSTFACTKRYFTKNREVLQKYGYIDHERWVELGGVWTPIPAIATHMVEKYLSPHIDWRSMCETYI